MKDPKLYLAVDNCFACKRWVKPLDWMLLIRDMGLKLVEQSADTECDPLYMGADYTREWIDLVKQGSEKTGVKVQNLYSGHGTYSTCGLAHWHDGVRRRFRDDWMKAQSNTARALDAGFGFFAHGFEHSALQSPALYNDRLEQLCADLANLAAYAREIGLSYIGLEQMYTPHMPPWTIEGTRELLRRVYASAHAPMYITLDIGHMNGQQYFLKPTPAELYTGILNAKNGVEHKRPWLGTSHAYDLYKLAVKGALPIGAATERIQQNMDENPQLFAQPEDGNIWKWTEVLGKYSPIVHLQQTDGKSSPHWPFSKKYNAKGVASGEKLLQSLGAAFEQLDEDGMPEAVDEVVLTLEPFVGTAANPYDAIDDIAESITYWRSFIPYDGIPLSEAWALLKQG